MRHLHAVEPDFPTQTPGTERGVFPIVFDKADVVLLQIETQCFERTQIEFQNIARRGFEHHLVLVVVLQAIRVLAVAAVLRTAARLHIGGLPGLGAEGTQKGCRV